MATPLLSCSIRLRRTPFSRRVEAAGVKAYTVDRRLVFAPRSGRYCAGGKTWRHTNQSSRVPVAAGLAERAARAHRIISY